MFNLVSNCRKKLVWEIKRRAVIILPPAETIIKSDYFLMILTAAPLLMRTK